MTELNLIAKVRVRRMAVERYGRAAGTGPVAASRDLACVERRATAADLAEAAGVAESDFADGLYSARAVRACCTAAGVAVPFAGPLAEFVQWLMSAEGREALIAFAETIVKLVAILAPLFV
jgi:hypothetical protein